MKDRMPQSSEELKQLGQLYDEMMELESADQTNEIEGEPSPSETTGSRSSKRWRDGSILSKLA